MFNPFQNWTSNPTISENILNINDKLITLNIESGDPVNQSISINGVSIVNGNVNSTNITNIQNTVNNIPNNVNNLTNHIFDQLENINNTIITTNNWNNLSNLTQNVGLNSTPLFDNVSVSSNPTLGNQLVPKSYVDALSLGTDWQKEVINRVTLLGDITKAGRYLVVEPSVIQALPLEPDFETIENETITSGNVGITFEVDDIVEIVGTTGNFSVSKRIVPNIGFAVFVENELKTYIYVYNTIQLKNEWVPFGSVLNHENLTNVGTFTHSDIDNHLLNVSNPHSVTFDQVVNELHTNNLTSATKGDLYAYNGSKNVTFNNNGDNEILISDASTTSGYKFVGLPSLFSFAYILSNTAYNFSSSWVSIPFESLDPSSTTGFSISLNNNVVFEELGVYDISCKILCYMNGNSENDEYPHVVEFRCLDQNDLFIPGSVGLLTLLGTNIGAGSEILHFYLNNQILNNEIKIQGRLRRGNGTVSTLLGSTNMKIRRVDPRI